MLLIDDLLSLLSPISGFKFVMRTLMRTAEEQWTDDAPLKEELLELQEKLDSGEISEEEYIKQEAAILRDIREVQERRQALAEQRQGSE
jgi:cytochrome c-type biogenesis protein CcmH/NrfG